MKINVLENCEKCGKPIEWDEYANNFGWCNAKVPIVPSRLQDR